MNKLLAIFLVLFLSINCTAQQANWLKGYTEDISGEVLTYHSPHPEVTTSLLIRNQDSTKHIAWLMDKVPVNTYTTAFTFVWIFGIDVNENSYPYKLYLNDQYILTFNNPRDTLEKKWIVKGIGGISISFNASLVDKYGDLMGYAFLTVPSHMLVEGQQPEIKITATSSNNPCWYMTQRYAMNSSLLAKQMPAMVNSLEGERFLLRFDIHHFGEKTTAKISANGETMEIPISLGVNYTYFPVRGKAGELVNNISVNIDGRENKLPSISLSPVRPITLYLLHHSHSDIGYTHHQSEVEEMHHEFFREAVALHDKTKYYPEGAQFKWNTEVCWAVESYLENCSEEEKENFIRTVQEGSIGLDGLWANELTGLCSPEELIQLIQRSAKVADECGVELRSAMITDIPGYTWSLVPVMAKSGIRYFSPGTNVFHRIGDIKDTWGDKPFYWVSQSGLDSVLTWFPEKGYSWFHTGLGSDKPKNLLTEEPIFEYVGQLDREKYSYDISIFRYNIGSDNGPPHAELPDIICRWNETYSTPKLHIATTAEAFSIFEEEYGNSLPAYAGDLTPYWEDGAISSAKETALVSEAAERLEQAQSLWVISGNKHYPLESIKEAWKYILLFDEHTWGSWNSISAPHDPFTLNQWKTKRSFALKADSITKAIMNQAMTTLGSPSQKVLTCFDIWNTHSWPVTDIVMLDVPKDFGNAFVTDINNNRLKSQALSNGKLAVLVRDVPPFGAKKIFIKNEESLRRDPDPTRTKPETTLFLSHESGDIVALRNPGFPGSLADISMGYGLNAYIYVEGRDPANKRLARNPRISYPEKGELFYTIRIESDAPGTDGLIREITLINGLDRIDFKNTIYKTEVYEPEGVHFAFPFNIPEGEVRINLAWDYYQPEEDQLPGANQNFYTMKRWVDVSSETQGVCLVSSDAPILELGDISMDVLSYGLKDMQKPTQKVFSYVMNNYWETNYLAAQPGKVEFRYSLYLHDGFDAVANERRALECTQPLIVVPSSGKKSIPKSLFILDNKNVIITALIPGDDKQHFLIRIYNPTGNEETVFFVWNLFNPKQVSKSGLSGENPVPFKNPLKLGAFDFETIRVDF